MIDLHLISTLNCGLGFSSEEERRKRIYMANGHSCSQNIHSSSSSCCFFNEVGESAIWTNAIEIPNFHDFWGVPLRALLGPNKVLETHLVLFLDQVHISEFEQKNV